jgi:multiple sugar transport system permease protein
MATTTASISEKSKELQPIQVNLKAAQLLRTIGLYALLIVIGLILFTPFILAFLGTFKTNAEIIAWPPSILPRQWLVENWPTTIATDLGGIPRPQGSTSLGVVSGMLAFFGTFIMIGMSSELKGQGLPRAVGLPIAVALAILAGVGTSLYLQFRFNPDLILLVTIGVAITLFMLIAVGIMAMSNPDWRRALLAMAVSLLVGALITVLIDRLAIIVGGGRFFRWFFNIAVLATVRAFVMVIFCSMAAYAFARMRFPGRDLLFNLMLGTMMLPGAVTLIPAYIVIAKMGWVNSAYGLVFPYLADAFGIFMLTQFLKAVPRDLEEAAFIDGASYFQIYKDVLLPLARPALLTLFIIQFQGMWNDFLTPLLYLNTPDMWVMNVALSVFQQNYTEQWNLTLVGAMINAFIPLTLFFFFSRHYIEGVSYAGVKG